MAEYIRRESWEIVLFERGVSTIAGAFTCMSDGKARVAMTMGKKNRTSYPSSRDRTSDLEMKGNHYSLTLFQLSYRRV